MSTGALWLRHPNATRQSLIYGGFAVALAAGTVFGFVAGIGLARVGAIVLLIGTLLFGYSAIRLATLKVRVDVHGIWEPDPFRLTYLTPWDDFRRAERGSSGGRIPFVGVRIVHADGATHEVEALKIQAALPGAESAVEEWLDAINGGRARFAPPRKR